jgi:hypothetical protein
MLRAGLLRPDSAPSPNPALLGDAPTLKFQNALDYEIDTGEMERARLFIAPRLQPSGHWPFRIKRWTPGNLIALTDRRLLWITESHQRGRKLYGSFTCYAHPDNIAHVETGSADTMFRLSVSLRNGKIWKLSIPEELRMDAREFAAIAGDRSRVRIGSID